MYILSFAGGFNTLFLIFISLIAISLAVFVIIYKNPVVSVLFLIGLFFSIALYLIMIGLEFIGLSYLLVYVGAISILFLFILMLINIRISELISDTKNSVLLLILTVLLFNIIVINVIPNEYINLYNAYTNIVYIYSSDSWEEGLAAVNNISSLGYTMYTNLCILILLVCNILLLAMVGAIIITIKPRDLYPNVLSNTLESNFLGAFGISKLTIKFHSFILRGFSTS